MTFGMKLKAVMKDGNLTQMDVVRLTDIGASSISQYLNGHNEPTAKRKKQIAVALGLGENYFSEICPEENIVTDPSVSIPVGVAAKLMGKSKEWMMQGLQDGVFPFGYAVKMDRWSYWISRVKFEEYTGIKVEGGGADVVCESIQASTGCARSDD